MVLREILSDIDGTPSTKRLVTVWLIFVTTVIALNNAFFHGSIESLTAMTGLDTACLASIVAERFGKSKDASTTSPTTVS